MQRLKYGHEGDQSKRETVQLRDIQKKLPLRVLSEEDWRHWTTWGYVVVRQAASPENVERLKAALWEFEEMDPNDPSTWGRDDRRANGLEVLNHSGMVEMYNHQALWDNRQTQRVYDAYVDIWDREDLWVTIDRANLNTPNVGARSFGGFLHWDSDTSMRPLPVNVQGVLALTDTDEEVGGFQCAPRIFRDFEEWLKTQPADRNPAEPDISDVEVRFVPMHAGDLLIFNTLLAHGIRPNRSKDRVRMAQYLAMYPADTDEALRAERVRLWREREAPRGLAFPGDPRGREKENPLAELNELGERLLGAKTWA
ncbi:MAG: phytanoyl-CoA dioxygenase family protein [Bryobacterales bacterium]|nr:phytanoyl-CoA dioxygenase family protein [Bryobacterales bacterium]